MNEVSYLIVRELGKDTRHDLVGQVGYVLEPMLNAIRIWDDERTLFVMAGELVFFSMVNKARAVPAGTDYRAKEGNER